MQATNPYQTPVAENQQMLVEPKMTMGRVLFSFSGRIPRRVYWGYLVVTNVVVGLMAALLTPVMEPSGGAGAEPSAGVSTVVGLVALGMMGLFFWTSLAIQVKRWHDRDKSGAWVLINLVPFIGGFWTLIECGFLRGTYGPNNYGNDPT